MNRSLLSREMRKNGRVHGNKMAKNSVPTTSLFCMERNRLSND